MTTEKIRVRFSTIINYAGYMLSFLLRAGFIVVLARTLEIWEFALWGVMISISGTLSVLIRTWVWWSSRGVAFKVKRSFGTGFSLSLLFFPLAALIFIVLLKLSFSNVSEIIVVLGIILLLFNIMQIVIDGSLNVLRPHYIGIARTIRSLTIFSLSIFFLYLLRWGLIGGLTSYIVGMIISILFELLALYKLGVLYVSFDKNLAAIWLRNFTGPLLLVIRQIIWSSIRMLISLFTKSSLMVSLYNVGLSILTPIIELSNASSSVLYASRLKGGTSYELKEVLRIYLFFSGALLTIIISMNRTIATLFGEPYHGFHIGILLFAFYGFILGISGTAISYILGGEREDLALQRLDLSSPLVKIPIYRAMYTIIAVILGIVFTRLYLTSIGEIASIVLFVLILLLGELFFLAHVLIEKRNVRSKVSNLPLREVISALLAGTTTIIVSKMAGYNNVVIYRLSSDLFNFISSLIVLLIVYVVVFILLSPWIRNLIKKGFLFLKESM